MNKITTIATGSKGNCYIIESHDESLMVECGVHYRKVIRYRNANKPLVGCLVSHEHGDHASAVKEIMLRSVEIFTSKTTAEALGISSSPLFREVVPLQKVSVGGFRIIPFKALHDAAEPLGFIISNPLFGKILFVTDTTQPNLHIQFGIDILMIECNYDYDVLMQNVMNGQVDMTQAKRIMRSHLSLSACKDMVERLGKEARKVILIHPSSRNLDKESALRAVQQVTEATVEFAASGESINI